LAPSHYDAIAFHSDDLADAGWDRDLALTIPRDWQSGVYALEVSANGATDHIPFFVRRPAGAKPAPIAFLVPTFSYLAYANERHWWHLPDVKFRTGKDVREAVTAAELWAEENRLLSCYDRHRDLSGCTHSSYLRPIVNMRAGYIHPYIGGPHQLSADLHILDWLADQGWEVDLVTDHDLHREGQDAISGYQALLTGSHPEYVSEQILDALTAFNRQGGHLAYLGGNGFYCAVSTYAGAPHVMELRRGHASGMHWKSATGEGHHASTGEPGGYWRLRGRSSHVLFGVGTAQVMFGRGSPYVRTPESFHPDIAWIFDGVDGDIDTESIIMGQPCGFEVDQMSHLQGTPSKAVRLASATFEPPITLAQLMEEQYSGQLPENRADLVYIPGDRCGGIFAASSIAWTGCLWTDGGSNKVAKIMSNLLARFTTADQQA
jgi:N,N-dimethylformamidase